MMALLVLKKIQTKREPVMKLNRVALRHVSIHFSILLKPREIRITLPIEAIWFIIRSKPCTRKKGEMLKN
jgi:hypothetical protein